MKLSTAAVIIAAGTSNVFSPNVVLAGKAGKLAPKASKAKTAKAQPSLSGSYSMSTGPSPPPDVCPCFVQEDLLVVTPLNVDPGKSDCVERPFRLENVDGAFFETGFDTPSNEFYCDRSNLEERSISPVEYIACRTLIINRCKNIGLLPVLPDN
jgi:hypothetical protein